MADEIEQKTAAKDVEKTDKAEKAVAKAEEKPTKADAPKAGAAKAVAKAAAKKSPKPAEAKAPVDKVSKSEASKGAAKPEKAEHTARAKPELDDETRGAMGLRAAKKAATPVFRRHEWFRYAKLGGKDAPWRRPRGIHSKARRHFKYRPPVVSVGYRGPAAARGLHPSGFEEVLVHRPADLEEIDPKKQAARVGGTVGGRKAELIEKEAATRGIRILNPRGGN